MISSENSNDALRESLLWRKMSRIIMLLAERLDIDPIRALTIFYDTEVCRMLHDRRYGLHCYSDAYIVDEVILELQRKQG